MAEYEPPPSITCPRCARTSFHPDDIKDQWCSACQRRTRMDDELLEFLKNFFLVYPNIGDTFAYACADTERIVVDDGTHEITERAPEEVLNNSAALVGIWRAFGHDGINAYVAKIRGKEVIKELRNERYEEAKRRLANWQYESD